MSYYLLPGFQTEIIPKQCIIPHSATQERGGGKESSE